MAPLLAGTAAANYGFLVEIVVHCLCPKGINFKRLGISPKESLWTDSKWLYRFDVVLQSINARSIAEKIHRWCCALVAAGYSFDQFSVTAEILQQ